MGGGCFVSFSVSGRRDFFFPYPEDLFQRRTTFQTTLTEEKGLILFEDRCRCMKGEGTGETLMSSGWVGKSLSGGGGRLYLWPRGRKRA